MNCAHASADCRRRSKPRTSGATSGTRRRTTRPPSRATPWFCARSRSSSSRDGRSGRSSWPSTWRCAATPMLRSGSTSRGCLPAIGPRATSSRLPRSGTSTPWRCPRCGRWRRIPMPARPKGRAHSASTTSGHSREACSPPDWPDVPARMSDWVRTASELRTAAGPFPEALAQVHAEFERIHPFLDGNGRAGRLLTNLLLIRMGYAPAILRKAERTRYLAALRRSDAGTTRPSPSCWRAPYSTPSCASSCRRWRVRGEWFRWPPSPRVISRLAAGGRRAGTPSRPARRARSVAEHSKLGHPVSQEPLPARGVARSSSR